MARPTKEGLIYFPLDVDADQDDKLMLVIARHGVKGFGIVIRLLMEIYKNGYYYPWTEKEQLIFSQRVNVRLEDINEVVNDCLKWGFFQKKLYERHQILTSCGIQKRYLEGTAKRKEVKLLQEYLLIDPPEKDNIVIASINEVSSVKNPVNDTGAEEIMNKVYDSTVNKSTVNKYTGEFEEFWKLYPRKKEKKAAFGKWKATLNKGATPKELIRSAYNYAEEQQKNGTSENYIKHAKTFLGPDEHWKEYTYTPKSTQKRKTEKIIDDYIGRMEGF